MPAWRPCVCSPAFRSLHMPQPAAAVAPCCPSQESYDAAVRAFAHGDRGAASVAIARAPADQLKRAVSHIDEADQELLEAASVMHLALGASAMDVELLPEMQ